MRHQSGSSHFRARFESAYQDYEKTTGITLATHPLAKQLENCRSVESITAVLQDQARALCDFQGGNKVVKTIRSIVSHLYLLSSTSALGDAIGLPLLPSEAVYASLAILLAAAKDTSTSYTALVHVLESIERFMEHLNIYTKIPSTPAMDDMVAKIIVDLLASVALATKELRQGRPLNSVMKFLEEKDVEAALQRLSRLNQDEARMAALQILEVIHCLVQNMRVVMGDGQASIDSFLEVLGILHQMVGNKNKTKSVELQQEIRRWLSPPDPWKRHNITRGLGHGDTGAWFVRGGAFSEWKWSGPSSLLWVHRKPGAGKSVLCSTIVEEIKAMRKAGLASLALFYYDYRDDRGNNLRGLLSSLLAQLCDQSDPYYDTLSTFHSTLRRGALSPSGTSLRLASLRFCPCNPAEVRRWAHPHKYKRCMALLCQSLNQSTIAKERNCERSVAFCDYRNNI